MLRLATGGGSIDRSRTLRFRFDGQTFEGFAGDTLASALLANDVRLLGRSFKYHRPRGLLTAGPEEPNALVTLLHEDGAEPNARATSVPLRDGLTAHSQNAWPSLAFDVMAVNGLLSPFFVAGFYYKTFMWPSSFWETVFEPLIRKAAGLGRLDGAADQAIYDRQHAFCDVLIVGAGPAGLIAALAAARAGLRVIIAEEDVVCGGRLLSERHEIAGRPAEDWARSVEAELLSAPNVRVLKRTSVFGAYDGGVFGALEAVSERAGEVRARYWKIVAKQCVVAAGACERPLVFSGNDRPGVLLASAAQTYLKRYAVASGRRVVVVSASDSGRSAADDLQRAGIEVAAYIDVRNGAAVERTFGGRRLEAVEIVEPSSGVRRVEADALLMAGGWSPNIGLAQHLGHRPTWSPATQCFLAATPPKGMHVVGAAAGRFSLRDALADGLAAARAIAEELGFPSPAIRAPEASEEGVSAVPPNAAPKRAKDAFVDFQHDVTAFDVTLAVREGYRSVEHLKRYTTLGMATDQGKTSNLNGYGLLAEAVGRPLGEAGVILSRPPHTPTPIGAFAGIHRGSDFRPVRLTPSHQWAKARGAVFVDVGQWKRAQWYPQAGERDWLESVIREVRTVRSAVGICDVSTLGKIDIQGADAGVFLDRLYVNTFSNLPVGKARYGVMLREDGFVFDDGTTSRFAEDRYLVTTTTANAARVMQHIDFCRQALWPSLDVQAVSVTDQWAQFALAGPNARALLQRALPHVDLCSDAVPYMAALETTWRGVPCRLFRLSFSGELAYEIAVPAAFGEACVKALLDAGQDLGVAPYGTEALGVMRIEKGHPAGPELNGQTTAHDLGLQKLMSKKKAFVGGVLARRAALTATDRPRLVGVRPVQAGERFSAGAHLLPVGGPYTAAHDQGWISSVAFSPSLDGWIGLALVRNGPGRWGERLMAHDPVRRRDTLVELQQPVFVDPAGERLHA